MTKIKFIEENNTYTIIINNHAPKVVCSAISAIIFALAGYLRQSKDKVITEVLKEGHAVISYTGNPIPYRMAEIGLRMIQEAYPTDVLIE